MGKISASQGTQEIAQANPSSDTPLQTIDAQEFIEALPKYEPLSPQQLRQQELPRGAFMTPDGRILYGEMMHQNLEKRIDQFVHLDREPAPQMSPFEKAAQDMSKPADIFKMNERAAKTDRLKREGVPPEELSPLSNQQIDELLKLIR
jgi:hypothetical protein